MLEITLRIFGLVMKINILRWNSRIFGITIPLLLGILACNLGGLSAAEEVIGALPAYPDANLIEEFTTGYPDSIPSVGEIYLTEADTDEIINFYSEEMQLAGWEVIEISDSDDNGVFDQIIFVQDTWRCRIRVFEEQPNRFIIRVNKL